MRVRIGIVVAGLVSLSVAGGTPLGINWVLRGPRSQIGNARAELLEGLNGEIFWARTGGSHFNAAALKPDGARLWEHAYPARSSDWCRHTVRMPDGGLLLLGSTGGYFGPAMDGRALRLAADGSVLWDLIPSGEGEDHFRRALVAPGDDLVLTGTTSSPDPGHSPEVPTFADYWVTRVSATGALQWRRHLGGPSGDFLTDTVRAVDGAIWLLGDSVSPAGGIKQSPLHGLRDFWVIRLRDDGEVLWETSLGGSDLETSQGIVPMSDGGALIYGWSNSGPDGTRTAPRASGDEGDFWYLRMSASGIIAWDRAIELGSAVVSSTADGALLVAGHPGRLEVDPATRPWRVFKILPDGSIAWRSELGSHSGGLGALAEAPDGTILVAGLRGVSSGQWALFNLSASGELRWTKRVGLPSDMEGALHQVHALLVTARQTHLLCGTSIGGTPGTWLFEINSESVEATADPPFLVVLPELVQEPAGLGPWYSLIGMASSEYVLQGSPDLIQWTPIATNRLGGTDLKFRDPSGAVAPIRLYRAQKL
jgi:outer membrane protein assembly factor BamB